MNSIYTKLLQFQKDISVIKFNNLNPFFNSKYVDLATIQKTIKPIMSQLELGYTQYLTTDGLMTTLFDDENSLHFGPYPIHLSSLKPHEVGSAVSYSKRYSLCSILGLIVDDEDDDGNQASNKPTATVIEASYVQKIITALQHEQTKAQALEAFQVLSTNRDRFYIKEADFNRLQTAINKQTLASEL